LLESLLYKTPGRAIGDGFTVGLSRGKNHQAHSEMGIVWDISSGFDRNVYRTKLPSLFV
jgi:hypothetical protein